MRGAPDVQLLPTSWTDARLSSALLDSADCTHRTDSIDHNSNTICNWQSVTMAATTVGYIGLGHAGYPMAACLAKKGYKLIVHDANPSPRDKFVEEYPGCSLATDSDSLPSNAFEHCSVLITMLPNGKVVRDALLGENGVAKGLQAGQTLLRTILNV